VAISALTIEIFFFIPVPKLPREFRAVSAERIALANAVASSLAPFIPCFSLSASSAAATACTIRASLTPLLSSCNLLISPAATTAALSASSEPVLNFCSSSKALFFAFCMFKASVACFFAASTLSAAALAAEASFFWVVSLCFSISESLNCSLPCST